MPTGPQRIPKLTRRAPTARREAYQESQKRLRELNDLYEAAQMRVSAIRAAKQRLDGMQEHEAN